jgi:Rrf2 family protein
MLSNSSKYALKAVLYLAVHANAAHKIGAKDLAQPINVPRAYLSKLLQELSRHQLVSSAKGPHGGFYLSEENLKVRLIDIINVLDGEDRLTSCMLSLEKCNADHPCPMHKLLGNTKTNFLHRLEHTTVADLVSDIQKGISFLPL